MEDKINLTTYLAIAQDLIKDSPKFYSKAEQKGILSFAKYLDSGNELGSGMQVLALKRAMEIDGEVLRECVVQFGKEAMADIVRGVYAKHRHTKLPE